MTNEAEEPKAALLKGIKRQHDTPLVVNLDRVCQIKFIEICSLQQTAETVLQQIDVVVIEIDLAHDILKEKVRMPCSLLTLLKPWLLTPSTRSFSE